MLYTRPELRLLLMLAAICLAGLAAREWRAGFPGAAERLERFDQDDPAAPLIGKPAADPRAPSPPPAAAPPEAAEAPLDLNRASPEELARLPGVGPGLARRIVEERQRRGRFESSEDLRHVLGMGPKKLAALRERVRIEP